MRLAIYMILMAGVTYLIRMIPFAFFTKKIESRFVRSFLYYVPYAVLSAMTFPAIFYSTGSVFTASCGTIVALILAFCNCSLTTVAVVAAIMVLLTSLLQPYLPPAFNAQAPTGIVAESSPASTLEGEVESLASTVFESESMQVQSADHDSDHNSSSEASEEASEAITQEATSPSVSLVMVGDILLHTRIEEGARTEKDSYDFSSLFENMKDEISAADLALVNEEVMIGGKELGVSGYPAFNAPFEIADALVEAGFDISCQATNHALDKGKKGVLNCLKNWEEKYPQIGVLGIHDSAADAKEIYVSEIRGIRIAILNYTYSTNGKEIPRDSPWLVDMLEEKKIRSDLQRADELADFVIVCPHWGTEYEHGISKKQEKMTQIFFEEGADLVLGTHPHVIEPVEWIREGDQEMLVYYSLGNYVNWTGGEGSGVADRMLGGMAQVTLSKDEDGLVKISDWDVEPLVSHVESGFGKVTVWPLSEYTEEMAKENEIKKQDSAFSISYLNKLVDQVWPFKKAQ